MTKVQIISHIIKEVIPVLCCEVEKLDSSFIVESKKSHVIEWTQPLNTKGYISQVLIAYNDKNGEDPNKTEYAYYIILVEDIRYFNGFHANVVDMIYGHCIDYMLHEHDMGEFIEC